MGYNTDFEGKINIEPVLNDEGREFLQKFAGTRRMDRKNGPYFVDGKGFMGQANDDDVISHGNPPEGQPSLWCQWVPSEDGDAIVWDGEEKFYESPEWMAYLIKHFLGTNPLAKSDLPFLQGHILNGTISAQGEESDDMWLLHVRDNVVSIEDLVAQPSGSEHTVGVDTKLLGGQ